MTLRPNIERLLARRDVIAQAAPSLDDMRAKFLRRLTVDSPHGDRRRKDYNQAIFMPDGPAVFTRTTLDMVLAAFDAASRDESRL